MTKFMVSAIARGACRKCTVLSDEAYFGVLLFVESIGRKLEKRKEDWGRTKVRRDQLYLHRNFTKSELRTMVASRRMTRTMAI